MTWLVTSLRKLGVEAKLWLVVDGAYAAKPFLKPLLEMNITIVSRLRKDAALYDLPPQREPGQRGCPRKYGKNRLHLKKRAAHPEGWQTITYDCRGVQVTRQYKSFLATSRLTGGVIHVVILCFEDGGWTPYFCTDPDASVQGILEAVADRWANEGNV